MHKATGQSDHEYDSGAATRQRGTSRRAFLATAGAGALGASALAIAPEALAVAPEAFGKGKLSKGDAAILHHFPHCAVLARVAMQRETKNGIVDRKRVERLFQIRPDRRTLRPEIDFERPLVGQKVVDRHIVQRAVGRPEPA